jgi:adenosylcobinamide-phosphate synthase
MQEENTVLLYSLEEIALILMAAIVIDWIIGDPRWLPHPVILTGKLIKTLEKWLYDRKGKQPHSTSESAGVLSRRFHGSLLALITISIAFTIVFLLVRGLHWIHPWLGYAINVWLISTTIAIKGLKDAALLVHAPLSAGDLQTARRNVGYIVGRDTAELDEAEMTRATVETVAENTVDAVVSPLFFAVIGAAPLAILYRTANTLDSMVGYKNERYLHFGWASARLDDLFNWLPARLTGVMLAIAAWMRPSLSPVRACKAIWRFASLHPSPNSGIPESAVAGALGIQLGGRNQYGGQVSERARMGWPLREMNRSDILQVNAMLYIVSYICMGVLLSAFFMAL